MKYIGFEEMKMKKIFTDENEEYGLDCSQAIWASDQLHQIYHDAKVQLSDADFMIENSENIVIMEYKNANTEKAVELSYKTKPFNPMEDKKVGSVIRKFYDSYHYLYLLGKRKPVHYIYVVEAPGSDSTMRKRLRGRMKTLLPFSLQESLDTGIKMIDKVDVMSIAEWNNDDIYGKYPFVKLK